MEIKEPWVLIRDNEVRNVFKDRKNAIKYFKAMLKQTLKDLDKQDKTDEFDYEIEIPEIKIKKVNSRESYLGLL